jgi:hypothetical protein
MENPPHKYSSFKNSFNIESALLEYSDMQDSIVLFCAFSVGLCSIHRDGAIQEKSVVDESESAFISRINSDDNYLMGVRAMPVNV